MGVVAGVLGVSKGACGKTGHCEAGSSSQLKEKESMEERLHRYVDEVMEIVVIEAHIITYIMYALIVTACILGPIFLVGYAIYAISGHLR